MELILLPDDLLKKIISIIPFQLHMILREVCEKFARLIKAHPYMLGYLLMYAEHNKLDNIFAEYLPRLGHHDEPHAENSLDITRYLLMSRCPNLAMIILTIKYKSNKTLRSWAKFGFSYAQEIDYIVYLATDRKYYECLAILIKCFPQKISKECLVHAIGYVLQKN